MKKVKKPLLLIKAILLMAIIVSAGYFFFTNKVVTKEINGLMMLIEFEEVDGVVWWEQELDKRNLTALVKVQDNVLQDNPDVFLRLANKGYEIAGGYDKEPFWDMAYDQQYHHLQASKNLVEQITGKPMRVFGSRYFAYDENTLKAADALGIEYILARGTQEEAAVIYAPQEYKVKVISVTNVDNGEMGTGSLCDYSLWARGAGPEEFSAILQESLDKNPDNLILVSHAYLGGTRQEWWTEYQKVLDESQVAWTNFDDWIEKQQLLSMPNVDIPVNREVKYVEPKPAKAIDEYTPVDSLKTDSLVIFHNGSGSMCLEALTFLQTHDIDYQEHLTSDSDFVDKLTIYQQHHPNSLGLSENYQYLPFIFFQEQGFSGFNDSIGDQLLQAWNTEL